MVVEEMPVAAIQTNSKLAGPLTFDTYFNPVKEVLG